jgi:aspartate aminotransferase
LSVTLAARVGAIKESASVAASQRVRELKASGIPIVDFTIGEPDFETPDNIKDAAKAAIDAGLTRYTPVTGIPALRDAIRAKAEVRTGQRYGADEVTLGGGAKQVIFLALMATVEEGVEVIVPAPFWVSYPDMVVANGGTPVIVPCVASDDFLLTPELLEAAITPRTRWVILNAPSNPSGAIYDEAALAGLAEVLDRHPQVHVLADDIYDEITYGDAPVPNLLRVAPRLRDRVLVVNGVSKSYAMTGWRIGYATGERSLIAAINKLQSQMSSCPSSISQAAAAEALSGDQSFVSSAVATYRTRRDLICALLNAVDGLSVTPPQGAFYAYVDCSGLLGRRTPAGGVLKTDADVVLYLLNEAHVATIQGSAYGLSPYFRISFATSDDLLRAGAAQIADAVARLGTGQEEQ